MLAFRAELSADEFQDEDLWEAKGGSNAAGVTAAPVPATVKDKVLKMSALIDQADESELLPPSSDEVDGWLQNYVNVMGAPPEEEEPTAAPVSGLEEEDSSRREHHTRTLVCGSPMRGEPPRTRSSERLYRWEMGPFFKRSYQGPGNYQQWLHSWRVFKTAALMLGIVSLAALQAYEKHTEKLTSQWPLVWGLIAKTDGHSPCGEAPQDQAEDPSGHWQWQPCPD